MKKLILLLSLAISLQSHSSAQSDASSNAEVRSALTKINQEPLRDEHIETGDHREQPGQLPTKPGLAADNIPQGTVIAWSPRLTRTEGTPNKAPIPEGWAICNGKNGTPNLTGLFIMGTDDFSDLGEIDGTREHSHFGETNTGNNGTNQTGPGEKDASDRNHTHKLWTNIVEHIPPHMKLIYLIKL